MAVFLIQAWRTRRFSTRWSTGTGCRHPRALHPPSTTSCWSAGTRTPWKDQLLKHCSGNWRISSPCPTRSIKKPRPTDSSKKCCGGNSSLCQHWKLKTIPYSLNVLRKEKLPLLRKWEKRNYPSSLNVMRNVITTPFWNCTLGTLVKRVRTVPFFWSAHHFIKCLSLTQYFWKSYNLLN